MNDDLVQPGRGFGTHGHANMEIVTYIVEGSLTHKDSMGTSESLGRGSIQFMTAGTGVRHSEHNLDKSNPLRFIQMWITPNAGGLAPTTTPPDEERHLVGPVPGAGANAGTAPVIARTPASASPRSTPARPRRVSQRDKYLLCMEIGGGRREANRSRATPPAPGRLSLTAGEEAHLLVARWRNAGSGRKDL